MHDWLRWSWYDQRPRDEAELRRFRRFHYAMPIALIVVGAPFLVLGLADLKFQPRDDEWIGIMVGAMEFALGVALLLRERKRVHLAAQILRSAAR